MKLLQEKIKLRDLIRYKYISFYKNKGIENIPALPLKIDYDPTLSFVNCTICHMKKMYIEDKKLKAYCVSQPALRTNTYHEIHNDMYLTYTASLEMLGVFQPITELKYAADVLKNQILWQIDFLHQCLGDKFGIRIEISNKFCEYVEKKFFKELENYNVSFYIEKENYEWEYGMDNIIGIGSNWFIKYESYEYEFGNVILLLKDNVPMGVESGGGIEVIMQSIMGSTHKIYSNMYATKEVERQILENGMLSIMYFDTIDVISNILWEMKDESQRTIQIDEVLEQYIRAFKSLVVLLDLSRSTIEKYINMYEVCHKEWCKYPGELFNRLEEELSNCWDVSFILKKVQDTQLAWKGLSRLEKVAIRKLMT